MGGIDDNAIKKYREQKSETQIICNPSELASTSIPEPDFGFWPPQGLGNSEEEDYPEDDYHQLIYAACKGFDRIEHVFKRFFNLPDDHLWTGQRVLRKQREVASLDLGIYCVRNIRCEYLFSTITIYEARRRPLEMKYSHHDIWFRKEGAQRTRVRVLENSGQASRSRHMGEACARFPSESRVLTRNISSTPLFQDRIP